MKKIKDLSQEELTQLLHDAASSVANQPLDASSDKLREAVKANRSLCRQALKRRGGVSAILQHFQAKEVACSSDSLRAALADAGILKARPMKRQPQ